MPSIHPLTKDAFVIAMGAGAKYRYTIRRGQFEMLLDPLDGVQTRRAPLTLGRDAEVGELTLSKTGRTLEIRVHDPPRLFLARAESARAFLRGELEALPLIDATDDHAEPAPASPQEEKAKRAEANARLRALAEKKLATKTRTEDDA